MAEQVAAIDNDFLNHLLEIKEHSNLPDLIRRFFAALQVRAVMHPLVLQNEANVVSSPIKDMLFAHGVISEVDLNSQLFCDEGKKRYYAMLIMTIYKDFTGEEYPCPDVINGWISQKSLGEVHTVVMCALLYFDCFLSDDRDAAKYLQGIVDRRLNWKVNIYNRQNRCEYIRTLPPELKSNLSRNELRMLSHKIQ